MKRKIGIFGGTFNPIHKGHLDSLQQVQNKFQLELVYLVPAFQNPFKVHEAALQQPAPENTAQQPASENDSQNPINKDTSQKPIIESASQGLASEAACREAVPTCVEVSHQQRLRLIRLAVKDLKRIQIDTQEILRQGPSYSIDTVRNMFNQHPQSELFFIMGIDTFEQFDKWHSFEHILQICHLIVMSRPRWQLPQHFNDLPKGLQNQVQNFTTAQVQLKTNTSIFFAPLKETALSSTQIRSGLLKGKNMKPTMPKLSADHIDKHKLYQHPKSN